MKPHVHDRRECRRIVARLSDYLDGALNARLRRTIERHGGACPPCRAFVRTLEATVRAVRSLPRQPLTGDLRREIVAALRRASRSRPA
jgi:anti-sigma factor RsiW